MSAAVIASTSSPGRLRAVLVAALLALTALALSAALALHHPTAGSATTSVTVDSGVAAAVADGASTSAVVMVEPGAGPQVAEAVTATGGEVLTSLAALDSLVVEIDAAGLEALRALEGSVVSVTPDRAVSLHHTAPEGEAYDDDFYPETVGATELHDAGYDGSGVGVAMIDTGVFDVPDLMERVVHAADFSGEGDGIDRFGHGTFTAGIIAGDGLASEGQYAGVAPGAEIISLKIAGADGETDVSRVLAAIQYVVIHRDHHGIDVLHLPIGTDSTQSWTEDPLNYAVQQAWQAGIVVVVAAGNRGPDAGTIVKPADDPYVITVGASDSESTVARDDDTIPDFSSRGPTADGLDKPDLVAPGAHLIGLRAKDSTIDQLAPEARVGEFYFRGSGTSFAAGVVSGSVALVLQANPDWSPDEVKGALLDSAADGPVGDPNVDGHGALDVAAAATLDDPPTANDGLGESTGRGDIGQSRGNIRHEIITDDDTEVLDRGNRRTAQNRTFNAARFTGASWQGASWQNTQWSGASWQGASWQGASWQGASWQGASWQGASWQGASWQGASWQNTFWAGIAWE